MSTVLPISLLVLCSIGHFFAAITQVATGQNWQQCCYKSTNLQKFNILYTASLTLSELSIVTIMSSSPAASSCPVGGDGGEEDPGSSSQQVHRVFGVRLPVENRAVSGHDHHERRRPEVRCHSLPITDMLTATSPYFSLSL